MPSCPLEAASAGGTQPRHWDRVLADTVSKARAGAALRGRESNLVGWRAMETGTNYSQRTDETCVQSHRDLPPLGSVPTTGSTRPLERIAQAPAPVAECDLDVTRAAHLAYLVLRRSLSLAEIRSVVAGMVSL